MLGSIEQGDLSGHWQPEIIRDVNLDDSFGYKIAIKRLPRSSDKWWRRVIDWLLSEPVSISQVLPLDQAIKGAIRLHDMKARRQSLKDSEVCVRIYDPSN